MVLYYNRHYEETFDTKILFALLVRYKEADCILYSKEGIKFNVHKEMLYQTTLMKNILIGGYSQCCQMIEIFCPCPETELESILNFLYNGSISCFKDTDVATILRNLTKIFGFPGKLFSVEDQSMFTESTAITVKKESDEYFEEITDEIYTSVQSLNNTMSELSLIQSDTGTVEFTENVQYVAESTYENGSFDIDHLSSNVLSVAKKDTSIIPFNLKNCKLENFETFDKSNVMIPPKLHFSSVHNGMRHCR